MDNETKNTDLKMLLFSMAKSENEKYNKLKCKCADSIIDIWSQSTRTSCYENSMGELLNFSEITGLLKMLNEIIDNAGLTNEYKTWVCESTSCSKCYMCYSDNQCSASFGIVNKRETHRSCPDGMHHII